MKQLFYIMSLVLLAGCAKEYQPINLTDLSVQIEVDDFSDTLYYVRNFNVTSTNDSVITFAKARISDENGNIILEDNWQSIVNTSFGLPERRTYDIHIVIYRDVNGSEQIEYETNLTIDNNNYPDYIKINAIEMDAACIDPDGDYSISNAHVVLVNIYNWIEYGDLSDEEYSVDDDVVYLDKSYAPLSLSFSFTNLILPLRSYDKKLWKYYDIRVSYPLIYFGSVFDSRQIAFRFDVAATLQTGNLAANTEYILESDDDASNGGGTYFGNLKYEWIYE